MSFWSFLDVGGFDGDSDRDRSILPSSARGLKARRGPPRCRGKSDIIEAGERGLAAVPRGEEAAPESCRRGRGWAPAPSSFGPPADVRAARPSKAPPTSASPPPPTLWFRQPSAAARSADRSSLGLLSTTDADDDARPPTVACFAGPEIALPPLSPAGTAVCGSVLCPAVSCPPSSFRGTTGVGLDGVDASRGGGAGKACSRPASPEEAGEKADHASCAFDPPGRIRPSSPALFSPPLT